MYSVRKTTRWHGNTNFAILILNLVVTTALVWQLGSDYLVIFFYFDAHPDPRVAGARSSFLGIY